MVGAVVPTLEIFSYTPRLPVFYGTLDRKDLGLHFLFGQEWRCSVNVGNALRQDANLDVPAQRECCSSRLRSPHAPRRRCPR